MAQQMMHIRNGKLHLPGGFGRGDILTDGGIIGQIGPDLNTPSGAVVLDATGLDVFPGIVLPMCSVGALAISEDITYWDKDETSDPITPQLYIRHAFDLRELKNQRMLSMGVTSYGLSPGLRNLISGQMVFINSFGARTDDVFLAERIALKGNFIKQVRMTYGQSTPRTHMAMYQMLDEALREAAEYAGADNPAYNAKNEAIARVIKREIPFFVNAYSQSEIESMLELGEKYNLRLVLCGAFAAHKCGEKIIKMDIPVVLGDGILLSGSLEYGADYEAIVDLYRKGLKLSIGGSGDEGYPVAYESAMWTAAMLRRAGATADEVIDMMTIEPAAALGMDQLVGSLAPGKRADIMICNGNPAQSYDSAVQHTIVAGSRVYDREADHAN